MKLVNKVHISELTRFFPHPVIVESLVNKYPVIIQGVEGVVKKRVTLGNIIPNL